MESGGCQQVCQVWTIKVQYKRWTSNRLEITGRPATAPPCLRSIRCFVGKGTEVEVLSVAANEGSWPLTGFAIGLANGTIFLLQADRSAFSPRPSLAMMRPECTSMSICLQTGRRCSAMYCPRRAKTAASHRSPIWPSRVSYHWLSLLHLHLTPTEQPFCTQAPRGYSTCMLSHTCRQ